MLVCKNVIVNGRRTSMRLDEETWKCLSNICEKEGLSIHELCSRVDMTRGNSGLSHAVRLFVLTYLEHLINQYKSTMSGTPLKFT